MADGFAHATGESRIEARHSLLGLLANDNCSLAHELSRLGINITEVYHAVYSLMSISSTSDFAVKLPYSNALTLAISKAEELASTNRVNLGSCCLFIQLIKSDYSLESMVGNYIPRNVIPQINILADNSEERSVFVANHRQATESNADISKNRFVAMFFHRIYNDLSSEISLVKSLYRMRDEFQDTPSISVIAENIVLDLENGKFFSQAISSHSDYFDNNVIALIKVGEATGFLLDVVQLIIKMHLPPEATAGGHPID
jgi:hypothetical protein